MRTIATCSYKLAAAPISCICDMKLKSVTKQRGLLELQALPKELKCSTRLSESDAGVRKVCGMTDESLCKSRGP